MELQAPPPRWWMWCAIITFHHGAGRRPCRCYRTWHLSCYWWVGHWAVAMARSLVRVVRGSPSCWTQAQPPFLPPELFHALEWLRRGGWLQSTGGWCIPLRMPQAPLHLLLHWLGGRAHCTTACTVLICLAHISAAYWMKIEDSVPKSCLSLWSQ